MPIWNIPFARNPVFTGRENLLEQLHVHLQSMKAAALSQPQAISGLGGIGKTQLALEYAYRFRSAYQAVLWARAETTEALNASYTEIARLLQLPQQNAQEQEVIVQAVKDWLRMTKGWLFILDNADDLALVQPFLPTDCSGHLVLTTRTQITGTIAQRFEVDTLEVQVGALLLLRRAGLLASDAPFEAASSADRALASTLSEELGGLPLALDQAGAYIEETQCSLADYHQAYQTRRAELLARRGTPGNAYPASVATTWSLSFAQVEAASPTAADLLRACTFLAPDAIPEELLAEVLKTPLSSVSSANKRRGWRNWFSWSSSAVGQQPKPPQITGEERMEEAIAILRRYSLLQRQTKEKMVRVHRLVQAVVRDALEERAQEAWMTRVINIVCTLFPAEDFFETWAGCERYLPQALICARWITQYNLQSLEGASLLYNAGRYLRERAQYMEAELLLARALAISEQQLGANHPVVAVNLNHLALLYMDQGKYAQAEPMLARASAISKQELEISHPVVMMSLNNLALLYTNQGKYAQAEPLHKQVLAIREQTLRTNHPETATSLNNLALLYEKQGKYTQAEPLYKRALAIQEEELGTNHPATAINLNNLAVLYTNQGKYTEAEQLLKRALMPGEQELRTNNHPDIATSLNNLAVLYLEQGKYAQAKSLCEQALAIQEQALGASHPDIATSLHNLARLYLEQGKYAEAGPLYVRALAIYEQHLGAKHPDTANSLNDLALLYQKQGKYTQAEPLYKRALAIREEELGTNHPATAASLNNLGLLYEEQRKFTEAKRLLKRALAIHEQNLGKDHPDTLVVQKNYDGLMQVIGPDTQMGAHSQTSTPDHHQHELKRKKAKNKMANQSRKNNRRR